MKGNVSSSVSKKTDLELLAHLQGVPLANLARKIGIDRGNLRRGLQGKRSIPAETDRRIRKVLGVDDEGRLRTQHVHAWRVIARGTRLQNLEDLREALSRLVTEALIGPTWYSASEAGEDMCVTVLACTAESGEIDPEIGPLHDALYICLVQDAARAIHIEPKILWPNRKPTPHMYLHEMYTDEDDEPLEDHVIPALTFQRIVEGRATMSEVARLIEQPDIWTWDKVVYVARKQMTAAEAAERLRLEK